MLKDLPMMRRRSFSAKSALQDDTHREPFKAIFSFKMGPQMDVLDRN